MKTMQKWTRTICSMELMLPKVDHPYAVCAYPSFHIVNNEYDLEGCWSQLVNYLSLSVSVSVSVSRSLSFFLQRQQVNEKSFPLCVLLLLCACYVPAMCLLCASSLLCDFDLHCKVNRVAVWPSTPLFGWVYDCHFSCTANSSLHMVEGKMHFSFFYFLSSI